MSNTRRLAIYAGALVLGVLFYVLITIVGIQVFSLSNDTARLLAFGALVVFSFVAAAFVQTRRRQ